jgi:hypothetical protein
VAEIRTLIDSSDRESAARALLELMDVVDAWRAQGLVSDRRATRILAAANDVAALLHFVVEPVAISPSPSVEDSDDDEGHGHEKPPKPPKPHDGGHGHDESD